MDDVQKHNIHVIIVSKEQECIEDFGGRDRREEITKKA
jgi:hypothetical protein